MGHVALAAPGIDRFHLMERFARELTSRGHRVTILCLDPVAFTFWSAQGLSAMRVHPGRPMPTRVPIATLAEADCRLAGRRPRGRRLAASMRRLQQLLPGLLRWFETDPPDLVVFHQTRSSAHRLVHFLAAEFGTRTLWTGDGLLPHTMQLDHEGLDGDARTCRRTAWDFRGLDTDNALLSAALAAVVGRTAPPALSRRMLQVPRLSARLRDAWSGLLGQHHYGALGALDAWHRAAPPGIPLPPTNSHLPTRPFLAVLLQSELDARVALDSETPPAPILLTRAARAAARSIDPTMPVVGVLPPRGLHHRQLNALRRLDGVHLELSTAVIDTCIAATAVVTINAPAAAIALLAHTPVVHLGRALYGIPGVAIRTGLDELHAAVHEAVLGEPSELQRRFLTWLLAHGHLWCSSEQPDNNGLSGLLLEAERRLAENGPYGARLSYRPGPAWPLAAEPQA